MTDKNKVKIIAKNKRAKERVKQHGEIMTLERQDKYKGEKAILVESLGRTAKNNRHWFGWFTVGEADWQVMT